MVETQCWFPQGRWLPSPSGGRDSLIFGSVPYGICTHRNMCGDDSINAYGMLEGKPRRIVVFKVDE